MNRARITITLLILAYAGSAAADPASWGVAIKGGVLMEGEVHVETDDGDIDLDTDSGLILIAEADRWVADNFSLGLFVLHTNIELADVDMKASVFTVGATLKTRFRVGDGVEVRPGLALGYQRIEPDEGDADTITGFDVGAVLDIAFATQSSTRFVGTLGFISQPVGGSDDVELTFEPIFYVAGGIEFGG